jgi:hypothetical protein
VRDFWVSSGHHLTTRDEAGFLLATDGYLAAFLARPELAPPPEACAAERALHAALLDDPSRTVGAAELDRLADPDAAGNWRAFLAFRDHLRRHRTLEGAYLAFARQGVGRTPPILLPMLVHAILRNALDGADDPIRLRAAELFFRPQRATLVDNAVLLADEETVEQQAADGFGSVPFGSLGALVAAAGTPLAQVELEVLNDANAARWWGDHERHEWVLDLSYGRLGQDGLARVIETWVRHMLGVEVSVAPQQTIHDEAWSWHVGLDAEASRIVNALWDGDRPPPDELARVVALFRLEFAHARDMLGRVAGRPVYLALAMTPQKRVVLKPQNLLVNLPLAEGRAA